MELIREIPTLRKYKIGLFRCSCGREFKKKILDKRTQCAKCDLIEPVKKKRKKYTKSDLLSRPICTDEKIQEINISPMERISHVYSFMMKRCYDPIDKQYPEYGGRGITVCDDWKKSETNFILWAFTNGFQTNLTLDREDNDKGYSPANCRFVSMNVQNANQRIIKKNNTSGYKGVSWHKKSQKWIVNISFCGEYKYLGTYDDPKEAAQVRDDYIVKHNLPHAKNF